MNKITVGPQHAARVAKNFGPVADAHLVTVSLMHIAEMMACDSNADRSFVVVSKWVGPGCSTTLYDGKAHQFYRATHSHGVRVFLKAIAENRKNVRLLAPHEPMFTEDGAAEYSANH